MSKKKIIFVIVFIVLIVGGFAGYQVYENHVKEEKIASEKTIINKRYKAFNKEKDRTKKLEDLKSIIKESNKYSKSKDSYSEVKKEYNSKIKQMRKYFIEGYDKSIADNTLIDVDNIGDKTQLNTAKDNLNAVLTSIKDEIETVSTKEEVAKYEEKINVLTTSYSNRLLSKNLKEKQKKRLKLKQELKKKQIEKLIHQILQTVQVQEEILHHQIHLHRAQEETHQAHQIVALHHLQVLQKDMYGNILMKMVLLILMTIIIIGMMLEINGD